MVGSTHPRERVISYLKYIPDETGRWRGEAKKFRRTMERYTTRDLRKTMEILRNEYPHHIFYSNVFNIEICGVPHRYITRHYLPEARLFELREKPPPDPLVGKALELVGLLSQNSGVSPSKFGVTGSILLGIHDPEFSDIDLTIYGYDDSVKVKKTVMSLSGRKRGPLRSLTPKEGEAWCRRKMRDHALTFEDASKILRRRWEIGFYKGTRFSINPVRLESESERYGSRTYTPIGYSRIRAVVLEDRDSLFTPSIYGVEDVEVLEGPEEIDVREVASYEGLYADLAHKGEIIEARGKLERELDKSRRRTYHRLIIGSLEGSGLDYVKLISNNEFNGEP